MRRFASNLVIVVGLLMLIVVVNSATAQGGAQLTNDFSLSTRDVIYALLGVVIALLGVWSRILDKRIAEANAAAGKALEKAHAIELQLVSMKARLKDQL